MRWAVAGLPLFLLLLWLPGVVPLDGYAPTIERWASGRLGLPLRIGAVRVALLPSPRLKLRDVTVDVPGGLRIDELTLVPALGALATGKVRLALLRIDRPELTPQTLEVLASRVGGGTPVVRKIMVSGASLTFVAGALKAIDAEVFLRPDGALESARLAASDGALHVDMVADGARQLIALNAENWQWPLQPALRVEHLESVMTLEQGKLDVQSLGILLYGGEISASAMLRWGDDWRLAGQFKVTELALAEPAALFAPSAGLRGTLQGDGSFKAEADTPDGLLDQLHANFQFKMANGALAGLDLFGAARLPLTDRVAEKETRFDALSGLLQADGARYRLRNVHLVSGVAKASGDVRIEPDRTLHGGVVVTLRESGGLLRVPLRVGGTLDAPQVAPTGAALAGAAVGTTILGPGLGTALGVSAADGAARLLGRD